jgi:tellurite resistance protein TerC
LRTARRFLRVTHEDHGQKFFARENGLMCITPMLLVLFVVESTDVLFAVDSVPAIIGITQDPFIVFTSNIFAILGLRALYFLTGGSAGPFFVSALWVECRTGIHWRENDRRVRGPQLVRI